MKRQCSTGLTIAGNERIDSGSGASKESGELEHLHDEQAGSDARG